MSETRGALEGMRVIDLSTTVAGAWCTRLLADFGADVILLEDKDGHPTRRLEPLTEDGKSVVSEYVLANKRSMVLGLDHPEGRRALANMVRSSDVVVESGRPGGLEDYGIGLEAHATRYRRLVVASITPHGQHGGREELPGNDLTAYARSGWASFTGLTSAPPLKGSGFNASMFAGIAAYGAIVSALHARERDGKGQRIDIAESEAIGTGFAPAFLRAQYSGRAEGRDEQIDVTTGPVPVQDGHFALTISRAHFWRDAMNLLGLTDLAEDRRFDTSWYRAQHRDEYVPRVMERMAQWKKMELFDALATLRVVAGPVLTMEELSENEHLKAREFFTKPEDTPDGPEYPGAPMKLSATPWSLRHRAPRVGEHTVRLLREVAGFTDDWVGSLADQGVLG